MNNILLVGMGPSLTSLKSVAWCEIRTHIVCVVVVVVVVVFVCIIVAKFLQSFGFQLTTVSESSHIPAMYRCRTSLRAGGWVNHL